MRGVIVCGVDGSEASRSALAHAAVLGRRLELELVLVHVSAATGAVAAPVPVAAGAFDPTAPARAVARGKELLEYVAAAERLDDVRIRAEIGSAADGLLTVAREEDAELIAVGCRGRGPISSALLGSVSATVGAEAPCPVLVAHERHEPQLDFPHRILCAVDDSAEARCALGVAADLRRRTESRFAVATVEPPPVVPGASTAPAAMEQLHELERRDGERLLARMLDEQDLGPGVRRCVVFGSPARALADLAGSLAIDLVVVGSRGRGPLRAAVGGSVSNELTCSAPCPVLVVPPEQGD